MKLTSHERKIVSRINKGEIYDIPSYLHSFGKGQNKTYDLDMIKRKFEESEGDKQYKVLKPGKSLYISSHSTQHVMGHEIHTPLLLPRSRTDIADDEWTLCKAKLIDKVPPSKYTYKEQEFVFDFNNGAFVADDFNDIFVFIRLWSYMRKESLVFEVDKPISPDEISMLYELTPSPHKPKTEKIKVEWDHIDTDKEKTVIEGFVPVTDIHQTVPTRHAEEFLDSKWKLNEDHLMMCQEFIGKKMYPTAASHGYAANNYRTSEEAHRGINTIVAVIALLISVLSFSYGLLYPSNTYQPVLETLEQQLTEIQQVLGEINENEIPADVLNQINNSLESIEKNITNEQEGETSVDTETLATDIKEIRDILSEFFPTEKDTE